ncbi:MAG TPA: ABC transporter substrate-binding protein [Xanthobacteraceae bacterium]|jgi:ABC-type nitrate/sulfonate/bicarbonate transport system substrate-binding protein|nr:ABC transporter substrate-binding protein [Xanthobacteraceae bacterium]
MFRIAVADLDSPSYFVTTAAVEFGFFKEEGVAVELEHIFGGRVGPERLRDGTLHFYGGPAYAATRAFPGWKGVKLLCALAQYSYWFMAVRTDLDVVRGDLAVLKGLRIASSMEAPVLGLRYLLAEAGIDLERDKTQIVSSPHRTGEWRGRSGSDALEQNVAEAFWGNGMRVAIATKLGVGKLHLDLRRGDGPPSARYYNFAALTTTERMIEEHPEAAAGAVRAIVKAQKALKADPSLAGKIGERLFPQEEASLIAGLIARDAPFYDAQISQEAVNGLNGFAKFNGLATELVPYDRLVATQFRELWRA